ncbi:unnamed protein product [Polarella glacialis]|uniref:STAS domain-containing protein n=1 Tax=Polarella glacialis TaxID=89957 RepID=A0A813GRX5_POLGL|nr:unnamed protein product [Polarella glacialis]
MSVPGDGYFPLDAGLNRAETSSASFRCSKRRQTDFFEVLYRFVPITEWLPAYSWRENTLKDVAGGVTLGCILVAQSLAHADLCHVSLISGPYGCILPPLLYSLFGTCIHSSIGTGGLISLLTGEQLARYGDLEERTHAGAIFTLLVGLVITLMGVFRLAFLVRFLSRPALSGFLAAVAILIMVSQFKPMLGLPKYDTGGILDIIVFHEGELEAGCSPATIILSLASVIFLTSARKLKEYHWLLTPLGDFKELALLGVAAPFACRYGEAWSIAVVGDVPSGLPALAWPLQSQSDFALAKEMLPGAVLVALVTFLSSFAGAKKFAMKAGYQIIATNELLALGAANLGGAICGAVPTQIGLSRMGIAYSAGIKSQLGANVYVAIVIAAVLQVFSAYLYFVPRCVLNAIILTGASHLLEFEHMVWLWSLRSTRTRQRTYLVDFSVWWVACLSTLYFGALAGIVGAIIVSLTLILYQVADPPITVLGWVEENGRWMPVKTNEHAKQRAGIMAFRLEGPLFYANIERLQEWLAEVEVKADCEGRPLKALILSAAAISLVDTTALEALRQTMEACSRRNVAFLVSNASGQPQRILQHVLSDMLPQDSLTSSWTTEECVKFLIREEGQREEAATMPDESKPPLCSPVLIAAPPPRRIASMPDFLSEDPPPHSPGDVHRRMRTSSDIADRYNSEGDMMKGVRPLRKSTVWASRPDLDESPLEKSDGRRNTVFF